MSEEDSTLTNEQKFALTSVRDSFLAGEDVDISLMHLIQDVAGFKGKDGRSKEGRAVKSYLSEITSKFYKIHMQGDNDCKSCNDYYKIHSWICSQFNNFHTECHKST